MSHPTPQWQAGGRFYSVTEFSDVATRDGLGWELEDVAPAPGRGLICEVFRNDASATPVLSAQMYTHDRPPDETLIPFTEQAVAELLAAGRIQDPVGWIARNAAAALRLAGQSVAAWRGVEMALDHDDLTAASVWSEPGAARVQLLWLALVLDAGATMPVSIYQDDVWFGLRFVDGGADDTSRPSPGYRTREDLAMPVGEIEQVAVSVEPQTGSSAAIVADVRLTIAGSDCALVAGEYTDGVWRRLDESVVAVPDAAVLDRLDWTPPMAPHPPTRRSANSGTCDE